MQKNNDVSLEQESLPCNLSDEHFADTFERCSIRDIAALYSPLSELEEKELLQQKGTSSWETAKEQLILRNLRLVMWLATRYSHCDGFTFEDIVEYGIIGLMLGIERYDYQRNTRLSTYVVPWIKKIINEQVMLRQGLITIPNHMLNTVSKLYQERHRMIMENIIEPSMAEILERIGVDPSKSSATMDAVNAISCGSLDVPLSADAKNTADSGATVGDFVQDVKDTAETATDSAMVSAILKYMEQLPELEQKVVRYRLGIDEGQPRTFAECGELFGCTTECCRQTYYRAIGKIQKAFAKTQS